MVRVHSDVPKRARNSITANLNKLMKKYGSREVRLVAVNVFQGIVKKEILEKQIEQKEAELKELKKN